MGRWTRRCGVWAHRGQGTREFADVGLEGLRAFQRATADDRSCLLANFCEMSFKYPISFKYLKTNYS